MFRSEKRGAEFSGICDLVIRLKSAFDETVSILSLN